MTHPQPFNVVVVTTSFPLLETATSGIFVARLVDHLPDDMQVEILTPACPGAAAKWRGPTVHVTPFRYAPDNWQILAHRPGGIPAALKAKPWLYLLVPFLLGAMWVSCLRATRNATVVHANWAINGCIAGLAGVFRGIPMVTTLRGSDVASARRSVISRLILRLALMLSQRVVCVSQGICNWLAHSFPQYRAKLCVIENGIDPEFLNIGRARAVNQTSRLFTLITVCNLIPGKGVDLIIRALSELQFSPDVILKIVGDGPENERLHALVESLKLEDRVQFLGSVAPHDIPKCLAAADGFVLASYSEGRPNVVLEAMAAGLPIIATDIEGVNEIVHAGVTGLLCPPGDVSGLAACIARLYDDAALRARLGHAAHAFIIDNGMLWEVTARRYAELYCQVTHDV